LAWQTGISKIRSVLGWCVLSPAAAQQLGAVGVQHELVGIMYQEVDRGLELTRFSAIPSRVPEETDSVNKKCFEMFWHNRYHVGDTVV
jgi:hypothetical protein